MPDFRPILFIIGLLLTVFGLGMLVPMIVDLAFSNRDWLVFLGGAGSTVFIGLGLVLANFGTTGNLTLRQAFLLTASIWIILPLFAAIPFIFSDLNLSFTDAYFEAMSGVTTTGATVISGLDTAPPGILLWRGLLQWFGGIGIVVMAVAVLPMLQIGGMQIFKVESFDTSEKILPRAKQLSGMIMAVYIGLTAVCAAALMAAGLGPLDAGVHAMTTIATGGYSTSDSSVGIFDSALVDAIVTLFMIAGSLPFVLMILALRGKPLSLWRDSQVQVFLAILMVICGLVAAWLVILKGFDIPSALRYASFNVVSILTGTGYSTTDYGQWGAFSTAIFFMVMFIGGCAGSTSCGIKIFRFQILFSTLHARIKRLSRPHGVFIPHYNGRPVADTVTSSVMSFLFLFLITLLLLSFALAATGLDPVTALSGAGTALANVGPGLGDIIGPAGTFGPLPDMAKWLLSLGMLLGRLELFTIFILFTPGFWRV